MRVLFELLIALLWLVAGILCLMAVFFCIYRLGKWSLGPLDRAARQREHPVQFSLVDLLSLIVLFQLPMAAIRMLGLALEQPYESMIYVFYVFGWFVSFLAWWTSVRTLSRAGVHNPWHRSLFVAVILPAAVVGTIGAPCMVVAVALSIFFSDPFMGVDLVKLSSIVVFLLVIVYASGRYTRYVLVAVGNLPDEEEIVVAQLVESPEGHSPFRDLPPDQTAGGLDI